LIYRITVDEKIMDKKFVSFYWLSKSGRHQITRGARGSSQSMVNISQEHILSWVIPMPPIQEQIKIVETIETFIQNLSKIQNKIFESKVLLQEYHSALISAAVTAKIDVRETIPTRSEAQS